MTFERSEVDRALARRLEAACDKMDDEPATAKSFPLQIAKSMVRQVVRALRGDGQRPAPVRKLAIVGRYEDSPGLSQEAEVEESRTRRRDAPPPPLLTGPDAGVALDDCPACVAQQDPESPDAA